MMKTFFIILCLGVFLCPVIALAEDADLSVGDTEELVDPGILPTSPFYFLKQASESLGTLFTFGDAAKAQRYAKLAERRLAEAKALAEKGSEKAEATIVRYEKIIAKANKYAEKTDKINVKELVAKATEKHIRVLQRVMENAPEQAKAKLRRAMIASQNGQERALENLSKKDPQKAMELGLKWAEKRAQQIKERVQKNKPEEGEEMAKQLKRVFQITNKIQEANPQLEAQFQKRLKPVIKKVDEASQAANHLPVKIRTQLKQKIQEAGQTPIKTQLKQKLKKTNKTFGK